jgi:hypothetical protein
MTPPINGTEQRLDAILAELRAIRARIEAGNPSSIPEGSVELREPAAKPPAKGKR